MDVACICLGRQSEKPSHVAMAAAAAAAAEESKGASLSATGGYEPYDGIETGIKRAGTVLMSAVCSHKVLNFISAAIYVPVELTLLDSQSQLQTMEI